MEQVERRARLRELLAQRQHAVALDASAKRLAALLSVPIGRDHAVTNEAVHAALDTAERQDPSHHAWRRVWGAQLRSEVVETAARLADVLEGERAVLVWGHSPPIGFLVPVAAGLRSLPEHIGPEAAEDGPGGIGSDLVLVAEDSQSGLRLTYTHHEDVGEYELRSWGRYARSVTR